MEDRERELQRAQEQGLPPGAQLRARQEHLAALLACFNLLAFAIHTVCDLAAGAWRHARETLGPRTRFFQNLQGLTTYLVFSSWTELLQTLAFVKPPPRPP